LRNVNTKDGGDAIIDRIVEKYVVRKAGSMNLAQGSVEWLYY
jgi:hypothetical protein